MLKFMYIQSIYIAPMSLKTTLYIVRANCKLIIQAKNYKEGNVEQEYLKIKTL